MSLLWSTLAAFSGRCTKVLAILTAWDLPRNILPESHNVLSEPFVRETNCDTHILALVVIGNFGVSHRNLTFSLRTPVKPAAAAWLTLLIPVVSSARVFPFGHSHGVLSMPQWLNVRKYSLKQLFQTANPSSTHQPLSF